MLVSRRRGPARELAARRRLRPVLAAEHAAFVLMGHRGWGLGYARWLAVKVALTAFLLVPLETMHAWIAHGWIARGLRQTSDLPRSKDLERGIGMEDMLRALAAPLLAVGLPLLVWLSMRKPF